MALFFDQDWFDRKLESLKHSHEDVAALLRLSPMQVAEIWKDQRELLPHEVSALARLLNSTPAEVADHAGVSTPVPSELEGADMATVMTRLDEMNGRLERIERVLVDLESLVLEQSVSKSKEV
tara:strand:+ start:613 stop:981 length:369 start_codon:yes stop_codon:yes gene_type:complete